MTVKHNSLTIAATMKVILGRYEPITESGCWIYLGFIGPYGYGLVHLGSKQFRVHRLFYEHHVGPIPQGLILDHLCRVRCCVNPKHLEATTNRMNTRRGLGPARINADKTHCPRGHAYDTVTTRGKFGRSCSICRVANNQKRLKEWHRLYGRDRAQAQLAQGRANE